MRYLETGLWADVRQLPAALQDTVDAAHGVADAAEVLRGAQRIVATGNGAAYYVAHALWLAGLEIGGVGGIPIIALPCGIVAREGFAWQPGDAVLAVSSSGEFRDVVEIAQRSSARPCVAITANADSALAAASDAVVLQHVRSQRAVTHTQALAGAYACGLAVMGGDLAGVVEAAAQAVADAETWAASLSDLGSPPAAIAVGGGAAWAAALELALMLKEISRIPAEGVETREGATSAMFGLDRGHLMVSLDPDGDPLGDEAVRLCAAAGATTLRFPAAARVDARLAPITTLPAAAALAAELALAAGHDVDKPAWTDAYYETARSAT
jgi:glucosamine 6-phosphate synthetase-like amidotransferase/phosphosugar isomerase protein